MIINERMDCENETEVNALCLRWASITYKGQTSSNS